MVSKRWMGIRKDKWSQVTLLNIDESNKIQYVRL